MLFSSKLSDIVTIDLTPAAFILPTIVCNSSSVTPERSNKLFKTFNSNADKRRAVQAIRIDPGGIAVSNTCLSKIPSSNFPILGDVDSLKFQLRSFSQNFETRVSNLFSYICTIKLGVPIFV